MTRRKSYDIIRIPSNDWDNITETVSLDGSYSEEIKNEIWSALENVRSLSDPWVVVQIKDGVSAKANLLANKEAAQKFAKRIKGNLPSNVQVLCVRARYRQSS